jgi:predicted membrane chloride channel (bestrophin family)
MGYERSLAITSRHEKLIELIRSGPSKTRSSMDMVSFLSLSVAFCHVAFLRMFLRRSATGQGQMSNRKPY